MAVVPTATFLAGNACSTGARVAAANRGKNLPSSRQLHGIAHTNLDSVKTSLFFKFLFSY